MSTSIKQISFLKYNNYANRTTHPGDTFNDIFGDYNVITGRYAHEIARISEPKLWNPNDGVTTTLVTPNNTDFSTEPDYLVVWFTENNTIESRWFITETVRLHAGQYQCVLRRDVFSEAWNEFRTSNCNIYRAIANKYDSIIYNNEPVDVNQILESEMELKDNTGCPWIVFYGDSPFRYTGEDPDDPLIISGDAAYDVVINNAGDITGTPDALTGTRSFLDVYGLYLGVGMYYRYYEGIGHYTDKIFKVYPAAYCDESSHSGATPYNSILNLISGNENRWRYETQVLAEAASVLGYDTTDVTATYKNWADTGKVIYDRSADRYYKLHITPEGYDSTTHTYVVRDSDTALCNLLETVIREGSNIPSTYTFNANNFLLYYAPASWTFTLEVVDPTAELTVRIPSGYMPDDNPYYIWCMPYGTVPVKYNNTTYYTDASIGKRVATAISRKYSRTKIWDVQILPYSPIDAQFFNQDGSINADDTMLTKDNCILDASNNIKGFIFCLPKSSFEKQIMLDNPIVVDDPKFESMTKMWRLYSPNYGSTFEFSVPKNGGLTGFNIRATYMPISPYIRIAPIWGGLYGEAEFKYDTRGLILGGDFSIARIDDKWIEYKESNKNYAAIFDRQIDNMDVMRSIQYEQEKWGVAAGFVQGLASGAASGAMVGGVVGGAVGGAVGGIGSYVTGQKDRELSERAYNENRAYATDVHNLQLQNVAAMPRSIAKTTAFNIDNRYFPIFATYTCTEYEVSAVAYFIINRSMTIGRIGRPADYLDNTWSWFDGGHNRSARGFIQGSIININTTHDTHFVAALNEEFRRGIFTR